MQFLHVKKALALNGYPRKYSRCQRKVTEWLFPTRFFESFTSIPHIQGVSDKIQYVLSEVGVMVAVNPHLTISIVLSSL